MTLSWEGWKFQLPNFDIMLALLSNPPISAEYWSKLAVVAHSDFRFWYHDSHVLLSDVSGGSCKEMTKDAVCEDILRWIPIDD